MTEIESALQAAIDAKPLTGLRLILADHLEEIGDPRADGYRVLDLLGRWPLFWSFNGDGFPPGYAYFIGSSDLVDSPQEHRRACIGYLWRSCWVEHFYYTYGWPTERQTTCDLYRAESRKTADDWAALAWADLTNEQKKATLRVLPDKDFRFG